MKIITWRNLSQESTSCQASCDRPTYLVDISTMQKTIFCSLVLRRAMRISNFRVGRVRFARCVRRALLFIPPTYTPDRDKEDRASRRWTRRRFSLLHSGSGKELKFASNLRRPFNRSSTTKRSEISPGLMSILLGTLSAENWTTTTRLPHPKKIESRTSWTHT